MAFNVNVLCPNGRRQTVKVSPNTRILEIIETVCQKQKFNAEEFNLKHQRTVLDVQVPFRYANLPNNAKLELVKLDTPRSECGSTIIALQLSTGERLQHTFDSTMSLWNILQHWQHQNEERPSLTCPSSDSRASVHPVCIYMREEIIGEDWLKATTLRNLGLTGGKAIIRLLHREVELPPPPKVTKPKTKPHTPAEEVVSPLTTHSTTALCKSTKAQRGSPTANTDSHPSLKSNGSVATATSASIDVSQSAEATWDDKKDADMEVDQIETPTQSPECLPSTSTGLQLEGRTVRPKEKPTMNKEVKEMRKEEKTVVDDIEKKEGLRLDEYARKRIQNLLEKEEEMVECMETALMESLAQQSQSQDVTKPHKNQHKPANKQLSNFKFPDKKVEDPKNEGKGKVKQDQSLKECERNGIVFCPNQDPFSMRSDVPDEFFDLTVDDVRGMMSDLRHQSSDSEKTLETKAMRDAKDQMKMRKYEKVVVRVHFPDRLILQGFFRPQETVEAVTEFVRSNLADKQQQFHLYTTPPKMVLSDMTQTLFKAKLFPAALVHFGSNSPKDHYLHNEVIGDLASLSQAESVVAHNMKTGFSSSLSSDKSASTSTSNPSEDRPSTSSDLGSGPGSMTSQQKRQASPSNSALGSTKVPKWFKLGKK